MVCSPPLIPVAPAGFQPAVPGLYFAMRNDTRGPHLTSKYIVQWNGNAGIPLNRIKASESETALYMEVAKLRLKLGNPG
jgi:hypothetical protein